MQVSTLFIIWDGEWERTSPLLSQQLLAWNCCGLCVSCTLGPCIAARCRCRGPWSCAPVWHRPAGWWGPSCVSLPPEATPSCSWTTCLRWWHCGRPWWAGARRGKAGQVAGWPACWSLWRTVQQRQPHQSSGPIVLGLCVSLQGCGCSLVQLVPSLTHGLPTLALCCPGGAGGRQR